MKTSVLAVLLVLSLLSVSKAGNLWDLLNDSTGILASRQGSADPIKQEEIDSAKGVAIIDITKAGFIIGGTGGGGVVLLNIKQGLSGAVGITSWSAPIPIIFSGGSFGAQIGGTNTKAIVILKTDHAVSVFTRPGKLGWDAKASGTAGADTQSEQAGGLLNSGDMVIYQESNGLYGGATFGGASLAIDDKAIKQAYGPDTYVRDLIDGRVQATPDAKKLIDLLQGKR